MKLSIVIPCYNEAKTIRQIVERVRAAPVPDKEILIVDDCSRDGTRELLEREIAPLVDGKFLSGFVRARKPDEAR